MADHDDSDDYDDTTDVRFERAVLERKFQKVEELFHFITKGVRRKYITGREFHRLHNASSPEIVRCYISAGVDVNIKNQQTDETPLLTVIKLNKSPDVVRELLRHGASVEARNKHTLNTPLNQAVHTPQCPRETIQILLEYGASVNTANKNCDTPLYHVCRGFRGDLRIVEALLKYGSPVNFRNLNGDTPLNASLRNGFCTAELVRTLLKFNAKVNVKTIQDAIQFLHNDYLGILSELIHHASITSREDWSSLIRHLLNCVGSEQKLNNCGKLLIKHAFLQCSDPYKSIVDSFQSYNDFLSLTFQLRIGVHDHFTDPIQRHKSRTESIRNHLKSFADDCFSQIERMKTDMLENNTSIYQLVTSKTGKVQLDSKILKILKESIYPIYSGIILNKIKRAAIVDKLVLRQVYTIAECGEVVRRITLDVFSVCNIGKYLNDDEIRNLTEAFTDPSNNEDCFLDHLEEIEAHLPEEPLIHRSATKKKLASPTGQSSSKLQKKSSPRI